MATGKLVKVIVVLGVPPIANLVSVVTVIKLPTVIHFERFSETLDIVIEPLPETDAQEKVNQLGKPCGVAV